MSASPEIPTSDELDVIIEQESCVTETVEYKSLIQSVRELFIATHRAGGRKAVWTMPSFDGQTHPERKRLFDAVIRAIRLDDTKRVTCNPSSFWDADIEWGLPKPAAVVPVSTETQPTLSMMPPHFYTSRPPMMQPQQQQMYPYYYPQFSQQQQQQHHPQQPPQFGR